MHPNPNDDTTRYDPAFYQFVKSDGVNYTIGANAIDNGQYATNGHPSDVAVAYDAASLTTIYLDSVLPILSAVAPSNESGSGFESSSGLDGQGSSAETKSYAKSPMAGVGVLVAIEAAREGPLWGYSTCHWIRACDPSIYERPGSPCSATLAGVQYDGFCFESSLKMSTELPPAVMMPYLRTQA